MNYKIAIMSINLYVLFSVASDKGRYQIDILSKQAKIVSKDHNSATVNLNIISPKYSKKYLREQRDKAINMSKRWLDNDLISLHDVLNYVLPHKVNEAPDFYWRENILDKLHITAKSDTDIKHQFFHLCNTLTDSIKGKIRFERANEDERFMTYNALLKKQSGSCIAMTDFANYTFRAFGIPVTTDFVPSWGNINSAGHAWNVLLLKYDKIPFMGTESNLNGYDPLLLIKSSSNLQKTYRRPPKIYRKAKYSEDSKLFLNNWVLDVTKDYVSVTDVILEASSFKVGQIFLATLNSGAYTIASTGSFKNKKIVFKDMARDLIYYPVALFNGKIKAIGYPIFCDGSTNPIMKPDFSDCRRIVIKTLSSIEEAQFQYIKNHGYQRIEDTAFYSTNLQPRPIKERKYELYYWNYEWIKHATAKCDKDGELSFDSVPTNAVYIIKDTQDKHQLARNFLFSDKGQVWY